MEDVQLLQVVDLLRPADEPPGDEAAMRQVVEEHLVRHEAGHGDDAPSGELRQPLGKLDEIRDAGLGEMQDVEALQKRRNRATHQLLGLAREEPVPKRVLGLRVSRPVLRNRPVVCGAGGKLGGGLGHGQF